MVKGDSEKSEDVFSNNQMKISWGVHELTNMIHGKCNVKPSKGKILKSNNKDTIRRGIR
jgi:hypothetical protein